MAVHYDQTRFPKRTHLSRHDLDGVPGLGQLLLRQRQWHTSVANTGFLEAAGVEPDVKTPKVGNMYEMPMANSREYAERAHEHVNKRNTKARSRSNG